MKNGEIAPSISVFGLKNSKYSIFSKSFEIWLDTMEIQYWSKFGVIWMIFERFIVIFVTHFSLFFIKANKGILGFDYLQKMYANPQFWFKLADFNRHHLWMFVQKCCVGKFEKIIF